jgi:hypothetical protein
MGRKTDYKPAVAYLFTDGTRRKEFIADCVEAYAGPRNHSFYGKVMFPSKLFGPLDLFDLEMDEGTILADKGRGFESFWCGLGPFRTKENGFELYDKLVKEVSDETGNMPCLFSVPISKIEGFRMEDQLVTLYSGETPYAQLLLCDDGHFLLEINKSPFNQIHDEKKKMKALRAIAGQFATFASHAGKVYCGVLDEESRKEEEERERIIQAEMALLLNEQAAEKLRRFQAEKEDLENLEFYGVKAKRAGSHTEQTRGKAD